MKEYTWGHLRCSQGYARVHRLDVNRFRGRKTVTAQLGAPCSGDRRTSVIIQVGINSMTNMSTQDYNCLCNQTFTCMDSTNTHIYTHTLIRMYTHIYIHQTATPTRTACTLGVLMERAQSLFNFRKN